METSGRQSGFAAEDPGLTLKLSSSSWYTGSMLVIAVMNSLAVRGLRSCWRVLRSVSAALTTWTMCPCVKPSVTLARQLMFKAWVRMPPWRWMISFHSTVSSHDRETEGAVIGGFGVMATSHQPGKLGRGLFGCCSEVWSSSTTCFPCIDGAKSNTSLYPWLGDALGCSFYVAHLKRLWILLD